MSVKVSKRGPGIGAIASSMQKLMRAEVLVGIPQSTAARKGPINNASLLSLLEHGSTLQHIPARPILAPSIAANRDQITPHLAAAALATLGEKADPERAARELNAAGLIAANGAKRYITEGNLAPNSPATIKRKGSSQPLIDTGALRRAITYVVNFNDANRTQKSPEESQETSPEEMTQKFVTNPGEVAVPEVAEAGPEIAGAAAEAGAEIGAEIGAEVAMEAVVEGALL